MDFRWSLRDVIILAAFMLLYTDSVFIRTKPKLCADVIFNVKGKGKAVPLQAWSGPEGSRKLRFPDFMTTAQGGGKVVSIHDHRYYRVNPDILSPVRDPLPGNGCGSPNHTYSYI